MPDGTVGYARRTAGKTQVFVQPDKGGTPRAVSPPDDQFVYGGAISKDGRIALSRGTQTSDVVLIKAK
jgi:hypothetical protein